jgi:4-hydroxy-tetrahydrodipicolinate synthase
MMTGQPITGVLAVFQTPFDDDGDVDIPALEQQGDWLFENGADGMVFAMVSEVLRLSSEERDAVAAATCRICSGRGSSVISVGAESTHTAVRHARHARRSGADAVMAAPPALFPTSDEALHSYFLAIAEAAEVPLIVQDASGYVGRPLSIDLQARLHAELGDRVLFKPEAHPIGPRLTMLMDACDGDARVFEGTGGLYLIDSFRRGAIGTMPAGDLVWALSALWKSLQAGDYDRAYRIAGPLALIVSLQTSLDSFVATEKRLLQRQGVVGGAAMRGPVGDVVDEQMHQEIARRVDLLRAAVDGV